MDPKGKIIDFSDYSDPGNRLIEQIFRRHRASLQRFLKTRLALEEDREELTQNLFLKLASIPNLAEKLPPTEEGARAYLYTVLTNLIVDWRRRAGSRKADLHDSHDLDSLCSDHPSTEAVVASQQQLARMMQILKNMKPAYRQVVLLNRIDHKSCRQIAAEMGISESTVERHLAAALVLLQKALDDSAL